MAETGLVGLRAARVGAHALPLLRGLANNPGRSFTPLVAACLSTCRCTCAEVPEIRLACLRASAVSGPETLPPLWIFPDHRCGIPPRHAALILLSNRARHAKPPVGSGVRSGPVCGGRPHVVGFHHPADGSCLVVERAVAARRGHRTPCKEVSVVGPASLNSRDDSRAIGGAQAGPRRDHRQRAMHHVCVPQHC